MFIFYHITSYLAAVPSWLLFWLSASAIIKTGKLILRVSRIRSIGTSRGMSEYVRNMTNRVALVLSAAAIRAKKESENGKKQSTVSQVKTELNIAPPTDTYVAPNSDQEEPWSFSLGCHSSYADWDNEAIGFVLRGFLALRLLLASIASDRRRKLEG